MANDSYLKSLRTGRLSGAVANGGLFGLIAGFEWLTPFIQDINQVFGIALSPEMVQRWVALCLFLWGVYGPVRSKVRDSKRKKTKEGD